jgi:hypothetical protein
MLLSDEQGQEHSSESKQRKEPCGDPMSEEVGEGEGTFRVLGVVDAKS